MAWPETSQPRKERAFIFTEDQLQTEAKEERQSYRSAEQTLKRQMDQESRGPYLEMGQGKQMASKEPIQINFESGVIRGPVSRDGNIHVARLDSGPETKLSLTTNSLVSPADLELASENAEEPLSGLASPKTIDPVDPNAIDINLESSKQQY